MKMNARMPARSAGNAGERQALSDAGLPAKPIFHVRLLRNLATPDPARWRVTRRHFGKRIAGNRESCWGIRVDKAGFLFKVQGGDGDVPAPHASAPYP